ncbi:MAG: hypothetical protein KGZ51_05465 [Erysipelothrix sp.]|nr:hypothetical protein [Erysipelothrix sp.]
MKIHLLWIILLVLIAGCSNIERFQVFEENENILSMGVYDYKPFYSSTLPDLRHRITSSSDIKDIEKILNQAQYSDFTIDSKQLFEDPMLFDAILGCEGDKNSISQILIVVENENIYVTSILSQSQDDQEIKMFKIQEKDIEKFKSILKLG